ncbi:hypothetical protein BT93_L4270 [Corymbia citriodora subsp. variegata]|uniref:Phosphoglycerate mutase n=1 Tax=Corymbia citriodora subsp. variegata TaxID=360336 RepID=A0A8T0CUI4_CORYI|nr:hypothetical protein BT93_L4270 [Corymbia citriodora subsp. variegata]
MAPAVKKQKLEPSAVDCQHVLVMRHGDRVDDGVGDSWWTSVPRPWDPPLAEVGRSKALETGKKLRAELGFPIHRIVVSPFQRCIATAQELIAGLSMANDDTTIIVGGDNSNPADSSTSRIKVSLEYGMSEMMNDVALWYHPTDRNSWGFNIEELEASFLQRLVELAPYRVFKELPQWGESESGAKDRYLLTIHSLVDRYPEENLLFITHGEGVKVTASTYWKKARGHKIRPGYFGYAHLQRQIIRNGDSFTANRFGIATDPNETGIKLEPPRHA